MTTKQLMNFDFKGFLEDGKNGKRTYEETTKILVMLLNEGYDLTEIPAVNILYGLRVATGEIVKKGDTYYGFSKPDKTINLEDLKNIKGIKVYESKEEWESRIKLSDLVEQEKAQRFTRCRGRRPRPRI